MKPDAPEPYRGLRNMYNAQKSSTRPPRWLPRPTSAAARRRRAGNAADLYNQAATFWNAGKYDEAQTALEEALQGRSQPRRGALPVGHGAT